MGIFEQFPYTNFHNLNLDWILKVLKEYGKVIDGLDEKIKDAIEQGLEDLNIVELILDAMTRYGIVINVKAPPNGLPSAVGDGSADDTLTIQGCIDYAYSKNGGAVYFPSGAYLTQSLVLKDNVSLVSFDPSTTRLVLKGGAIKPMLSGNVNNCTISNIALDGKMSIQVNSIDVVDLIAKDLIIHNVKITDGYNLMKIQANGCVRGSLIDFGKSVIDALIVTGSGEVSFSELIFHELSALSGRYIINNTVDNALFNNIYSSATTETAILNQSNKSAFIGRILKAINTIDSVGSDTYTNFYERGGTGSKKLEDEVQARIDADNLLRMELNEEITNRTNADILLRQTIDTNEQASIMQDNILQENIDAEKQARINADLLLQQNIDSEILNRTNADNLLIADIETEVENRTNADIMLQENIDTESLRIDNLEYYNMSFIDTDLINVCSPPKPLVGAVGDGVADDTKAINDILQYVRVNKLKGVYFPNKTFLIDGVDLNDDDKTTNNKFGGIIINFPTTIVLHKDALIKQKPTTFTGYCILNINNTENVTIIGGRIRGDRLEHLGTTGEQGHGIKIITSKNIIIKDMEIFNCWGDGILIYYNNTPYIPNDNILIENVIMSNNRRCGIAPCDGNNIRIIGCTIRDTNGTEPNCGIDIEADGISLGVSNVLIQGCTIVNNMNRNVLFGGSNNLRGVRVIDNYIQGSKVGIESIGKIGESVIDVTITGNSILGSAVTGISMERCDNVKIVNNTIQGLVGLKNADGIKYIRDVRTTVIENNTISWFNNAIRLVDLGEINTSSLTSILNNIVFNVVKPILGGLTNGTIMGNNFSFYDEDISLYLNDGIVSNNTFMNCLKSALFARLNNVKFSGNKFSNISEIKTNAMIQFGQLENCFISDNYFDSVAEQVIINDLSVSTTKKNVIANNFLLFETIASAFITTNGTIKINNYDIESINPIP